MFGIHLVVALAAVLVGALVLAQDSQYSEAQLDEIEKRITDCLTSIPETADSTPGPDCKNGALMQTACSYAKEALVDDIVDCLNNYNVSSGLVSAAQTCLTASLAKPLTSS